MVTAKPFSPYIETTTMQWKLIEKQKLRMYRLKVMIEDHEKELASLKERVVFVEKRDGDSEGKSSIKAYIDFEE